jgi:hypothetical protein
MIWRVAFACTVNFQLLPVHGRQMLAHRSCVCFAPGHSLSTFTTRRSRLWQRPANKSPQPLFQRRSVFGAQHNSNNCQLRRITMSGSQRNRRGPVILVARCFVRWRSSLAVVKPGTKLAGIEAPSYASWRLRRQCGSAAGRVDIRFRGEETDRQTAIALTAGIKMELSSAGGAIYINIYKEWAFLAQPLPRR